MMLQLIWFEVANKIPPKSLLKKRVLSGKWLKFGSRNLAVVFDVGAWLQREDTPINLYNYMSCAFNWAKILNSLIDRREYRRLLNAQRSEDSL